MNEDLYPSNNPTNIEPEPAIATATTTDNTSGGFFEFGSIELPELDVIISHIILFSLIWSILYTLIAFAEFYFYNIKHHDRESGRLKRGFKDGWQVALKLWLSNLVCLVVTAFYMYFRETGARFLFGVISILLFVIKICYYDVRIIPVINKPAQQFWDFVKNTLDSLVKKITEKPKESKT